MNLQQLEYIVAVDTHRHFAKAAEQCFVTQATLSMMIKKLEQELKLVLFDRSKQPVVPTEAGKLIIEQARVVLRETSLITQKAKELQQGIHGVLRIGIIPTLAPYLLPLFLPSFLQQYPDVKLKISEQTTDRILRLLASDKLDVGIMATPLHDNSFRETHLFYEEFKVYVAGKKEAKKKYFLPEDIDVTRLWLLEEGHCLRSQVLNLCELQRKQALVHHLDYETGSIESLLRITNLNGGITIIPELAALQLNDREKIHPFKSPVPAREISLVTYRHFIKQKLLQVLEQEIVNSVQHRLFKSQNKNRVVPT